MDSEEKCVKISIWTHIDRGIIWSIIDHYKFWLAESVRLYKICWTNAIGGEPNDLAAFSLSSNAN